MIINSGTPIPHRETPFRPGPHPNRSECHTSGLRFIIIPDSTHTSEIVNSHHKSDYVIRNSVLFLDRNTAESSGASRAQTTDSLTIPDRADTEPVETTQTGSLIDQPDSPYTDHVDDSVLPISGRDTGSWRDVRLSISDTGPSRGTSGSVGIYFKNITQCKRDWDWSVGMLSLRGVIHGTTDRVSHTRLRPCDRN